MRRAIRSRFCWSVSGILRLSRGAALDALFVVGTFEDGVDENSWRVHLVGIEFAEFDEFFDFRDYEIACGGHHRIEIPGGLAVNQIAPAIALPGFYEREIAAQRAFHHIHAAVEFAGFLAFSDQSAEARRSV